MVLRAKSAQKIGNKVFYKNEPVIYFDTLKTSSMEGAASTVYAQGGRGNARLMAWEGERTVTFTMEDALISPEGFMILSGAGLIEASADNTIKQHTTETIDASNVTIESASHAGAAITGYKKKANATVDAGTTLKEEITVAEYKALSAELKTKYDPVKENSPSQDGDHLCITLSEEPYSEGHTANGNFIFVMLMKDGEIVSEPFIPDHEAIENKKIIIGNGSKINAMATAQCPDPADDACAYKVVNSEGVSGFEHGECEYHVAVEGGKVFAGIAFDSVLVDYYVERASEAVQIDISADKFGGNYYLEASTLFRDQNGADLPAEFIIPNCKIQSNFTFSMASSGDPSTFSFTMDAFPDYTRFDHSKKVLAAIQIIKNASAMDLHRHSTVHEAAHDELFF